MAAKKKGAKVSGLKSKKLTSSQAGQVKGGLGVSVSKKLTDKHIKFD